MTVLGTHEPITAADVLVEALVEHVENTIGGDVGVRNVEELGARYGFVLDEVDLETPLEARVRQAHAVEAVLRQLERTDRRVKATLDTLTQVSVTVQSMYAEAREANHLARRSWWRKLRGAR